MGALQDNLSGSVMPDIGSAAGAIIDEAERLGGAVLIYDANDGVQWVNSAQRVIMPCSDYSAETYAGLFWAALKHGFVGNPAARQRPQEWLELATIARAGEPWLQTLNHYSHGAMAVTHRRIDRGWSMQIRFPVRPLDAARPGDLLVTSAASAREIAALHRVLDYVDLAVAIVDQQGQCLYTNASLRDLVCRDAGLGIVAGRLRPARAIDRRWWRQALAVVSSLPSVHMVLDRSGRPASIVAVQQGEHFGTAIVLAAPIRPGVGASVVGSVVDLLGVSRPVAEVLAMMAAGGTVDEIAEARGSTSGTVYQQVAKAKRAVARMGVPPTGSSHVQLAGVVMRLAAATGAPRAHNQTEGL